MINLNFNISNPWSDRWTILWNKSKSLSKHKTLEFNGYQTFHIIELWFEWTARRDHEGVRILVGLLGHAVELHFYDTRHWNYETNSWELYE